MPVRMLLQRPRAAERFRERLQRELAARCARNARYSLRGFANFLGIDHATLSQLLRGKRAATATTIRRLGARIGLGAEEIAAYQAAERGSLPGARATPGAAEATALDWHAWAILELVRLAEFRPDVGWISRVLGATVPEVQVALQHLVRLGFLRMASRDTWEDLTAGTVVCHEQFTVVALQRLLERSMALQSASARKAAGEPRLHGAVTLAITPAQLGHLLALAEKLLREAGSEPHAGAAEQLYQLEIHCFPVSPHTDKG